MKNRHLYNLGQFLIWGDFYLVLFFTHSLFVSPITVETYFVEYWQVAFYLFHWFQSLNSFFEFYLDWVLTWPAALLFSIRFIISTSIGIWLVRKFG